MSCLGKVKNGDLLHHLTVLFFFRKRFSLLLLLFITTKTIATSSTIDTSHSDPLSLLPGKTIYEKVCATCHDKGITGAPPLYDNATWDLRINNEIGLLYSHVIEGYNKMPPLGGCVTCSRQDIIAATNYLLVNSVSAKHLNVLTHQMLEHSLNPNQVFPSYDGQVFVYIPTTTQASLSPSPFLLNENKSPAINKKTHSDETLTFAQLMSLGKKNYETQCAACHKADGAGTILGAPALRKGLFSSSYLAIDKPSKNLIKLVLLGVPGTTMISFGSMLDDEQLASILTYVQNAWGNNTGNSVQPVDIRDIRNQLNTQLQSTDNNNLKNESFDKLMQIGKNNYRAFCARCHQIDGKGKAPFGPTLQNSYVASSSDLISYRIKLVLNGVPGTRMRGYGQQLSNEEIASLLTYIANAWRDNNNQTIQAADIDKIRKQLSIPVQALENNSTQKNSYAQLMAAGKINYLANCARCHMPDGSGGAQPGVPSFIKNPIVTGKPIDKHIDIVLTGVPGSIMRTFAPRLTDYDIASIITYMRNAWGNNTNDIVQPLDIQRERIKLQKIIDYQTQNQLLQQYYSDEKAGKNNELY